MEPPARPDIGKATPEEGGAGMPTLLPWDVIEDDANDTGTSAGSVAQSDGDTTSASAPIATEMPVAEPRERVRAEFVGRRRRLFSLAFRAGILTVLTLGLYRFWMKTRLRRWYWSSIRPGGIPLEYAGNPWEKLLGFLIAVVILAFYIGVVNLVLMFASYSFFQGNFAGYALSFAGVVPLWFYARYRARRYVLARTRWRGIRFGLEPGAWGYAARAIWHWALTLLSFGILWPRMTYKLEEYRTNRTWYGDARLHQGGRWTMLLRPFLPVWFAFAAPALMVSWFALTYGATAELLGSLGLVLPLGLVYFFWAAIHYNVQAARRLHGSKTAGEISFVAAPRTARVMGIYVLGYGLVGLLAALPFAVLVGVLIIVEIVGQDGANILDPGALGGLPQYLFIIAGIAIYFLIFLLWATLRHVFVTLPLWRHYAETLEVVGAEAIGRVRQRGRDDASQAEGFAEALDVGAAI